MCSLQEHIEREARARAAESAVKLVVTDEIKGPFKVTWDENGKAAHEAIHTAVYEHLAHRAQNIDEHCRVALILGCGVRVKTYADGSYTVAIDPAVPAATIYEEHPDQPSYGMTPESD